MIPRNIYNILIEQNLLRPDEQGSSPLLIKDSALKEGRLDNVFAWIKENQAHPEISTWLNFLKECRQEFGQMREKMGYWNKEKSHKLGHDQWSVGWAGDAILPFAAFLYALKSYESEGVILECGAFKGSSTACLSIISDKLDMQLICADSFEGLPADEGHYSKGDFFGRLNEVQDNVSACGVPERVTYLQGWYAESLKTFEQPISLLWIDVDLQESTLDVLNNVYANLSTPSIILSDGFTVGVDFTEDNQIVYTGGEAAGLHRFFKSRSIAYQAVPGWSKGLAIIHPTIDPDERIVFDSQFFNDLVSIL